MRISRLTIDKLGVKLYDKVSAVVAELVANGYDADAEEVKIKIPLSTALATRTGEGIDEKNYTVEVVDDGHGMTPMEAQEFYMSVGRDRREKSKQGKTSREKERHVMGRKGIGKLAPFGVCKRIEVISSGGPKGESPYVTSHFVLEYDELVKDVEEPVEVSKGSRDGEESDSRGTTIRLTNFLPKRVPDAKTFKRQLSRRFVFAEPQDFAIVLADTRSPDENPPEKVDPVFEIPVFDNTKIDLGGRPIETEQGRRLPVKGWLAMAKSAYSNEEEAGVRIYARNKIVATTRDFEQPAGFTGEFTVRSYLVGEVHAEWLDEDEGEDLIRSDRQGIIWESEYGRALRSWGAGLIKEIGKKSRKPRRDKARDKFMSKSEFKKRARERFGSGRVAEAALDLANRIGSFAAEDELKDEEYVDGLAEIILTVAPHQALMESFREFSEKVRGRKVKAEDVAGLFDDTRLAELASYSQIASHRVEVITRLESIVDDELNEREFQRVIADAPWLIEPTWSILTENQGLKTFKNRFKSFWKKRRGEELVVEITHPKKRPDFTLVNIGHMLHVVEIKKSGHDFDDGDFGRLTNYVHSLEDFFNENTSFYNEFSRGWQITIVADGEKIRDRTQRDLYRTYEDKGYVRRVSWNDFLLRARKAHELFLKARDLALVAKKNSGS